jgi:hypothetical protein
VWMPTDLTPGDVMQPLQIYELVSSSTTVLDAVELFGTKTTDYFYVIDINDVIGVLRYRNLFRPLGRLAFIALALEIEDQALRLCSSHGLAKSCWRSLSNDRRSKAIELYEQRYGPGRRLLARLIACTHLVDKARMIWKQRLITTATSKDVLGFFQELKTIRDLCVHPGNEAKSLEALPKERLAQFVKSAKRMRSSLSESMEVHGVGDWAPSFADRGLMSLSMFDDSDEPPPRQSPASTNP